VNRPQRTLGREAAFEGVGLHTGKTCRLQVKPLPTGSGIRFYRTDLSAEVPVDPDRVTGTVRGTTLTGEKGAEVHTVEHFLAAAAGLGLDNLRVELDGEEMPILDGSSKPYLEGLRAAGVKDQDRPVDPLRVSVPLEIREGGARLRIEPSDHLVLDVTVAFPYPGLENQRVVFEWADGAFERELAPARTFCFEEEVEGLRAQGLIRGGSLDCALVVGKKGVLNGPLRFENEFARHKALDLMGDLMLLNRPLQGRVIVERSGHRYNVRLAKAIRDAARNPKGGAMLDIEEIQKVLPHRYPFLFVDRILELDPGKRAVGIKNVTFDEPFFQGHFPGHPIMPGVLILEAMAQVGGLALLKGRDGGSNMMYFAAADNVRFRRPVKPGDQLRLEVEIISSRGKLVKAAGKAWVDGQIASEAEITCVLVDLAADGKVEV
jgi:UDP-3-O-[3-hydroxymyristoyl] N-acetylglucosamine deacetylase/3-hydroxyacyl-[acyl-carrier-protein] dehydratase